jgi:Putative Flp pilus-assembly TadE/G-like
MRKNEKGQALLLAAVGLTVFILAAGLGIDMGYLRYEKRLQQSAADSAAIAGAAQYGYEGAVCDSTVSSAAKTDSASNGFTDGSNQVTVTASCPPNDGPHAGLSGYVEVLVSQVQPTFFMRIVGVNSATVTARAVAFLGNGPACVYALDPSAAEALNITSSVTVGCGVIDDSNASNALTASGTLTAPFIGVVGGVSGDSPSSMQTGIVPAADPLASVPAPAVGACTFPNSFTGTGSVTISPGTYCGGLTVTGKSSVTFSAGTYVILGGGLTITGNSSVTANNVTFYLTFNGTYAYGPVTVSGNSNATFSAPTSGSLNGMLFFQDRTVPSSTSPSEASTLTGDAFVGAVYFPTTSLTFTENSSSAVSTILVGDTVTIGSPTNISNVSAGQSPIKDAVLVE